MNEIDPQTFKSSVFDHESIVSICSYLCNVLNRTKQDYFIAFAVCNCDVLSHNEIAVSSTKTLLQTQDDSFQNDIIRKKRLKSKTAAVDSSSNSHSNQTPKREFLLFVEMLFHYVNIYFSFRSLALRKAEDTRNEQDILIRFLFEDCIPLQNLFSQCNFCHSENQDAIETDKKKIFRHLIISSVRMAANSAINRDKAVGASIRQTLKILEKTSV